MTAPLPPALRRLSADERAELRTALSSRRARVFALIKGDEPSPHRRTMATLDGLLASVDEIRVEVPR